MISGKTFADRCDWVFINGDLLYKIPLFRKKFVWVVHNTDRPFGPRELEYLLPYAIRIYAINTTVSHPLLKTIPIGFVDRQLPFIMSFKRPNVERDIEIYANFAMNVSILLRTIRS